MRNLEPRGWIAAVAVALLALTPTELAHSQASQSKPSAPVSPGQALPKFIGVSGCAKCHSSDATGKQVQTWQASPHAQAYKTLGTDAAQKIAAARGVKDPQAPGPCLRCHTTGAGIPKGRFAADFQVADGVQCESCHGPGEFYSKIEHMIVNAKAHEMGLIDPSPAVCTHCHNPESPTFKGFDFKTAVKKIQHRLASY